MAMAGRSRPRNDHEKFLTAEQRSVLVAAGSSLAVLSSIARSTGGPHDRTRRGRPRRLKGWPSLWGVFYFGPWAPPSICGRAVSGQMVGAVARWVPAGVVFRRMADHRWVDDDERRSGECRAGPVTELPRPLPSGSMALRAPSPGRLAQPPAARDAAHSKDDDPCSRPDQSVSSVPSLFRH
jgi:hypothetical protein